METTPAGNVEMVAPREVIDLIERFQENRDVYCSSQYNEAQARIEFIDPFFEALGWDMTNEKGYAEAYKEVIHEDAIKVGGATKAPDYAFRIGGVRKFFVEAKRPGLNIKEDSDAAYQLRRYAWSAKLSLSIVTDFEEFAVYDCRIKPAKTDKASVGRVLYLTVDQYDKRWDEIAQIFSQDAILTGSFDKYVQSAKKKRGTAEVDTAFLKEIEAWRDVLARNIALRNAELSTRELNFAVQRTIDRIIFLRICEDRGIEDYGQLMALQNGTNIYQRLCQIFRRADERYNSGLFHFTTEKDRLDPPDNLTLNLTIDDNLIKGIIKGLYYPESPFEFSVLPADILGHIYEQFLGKVIRLTPGHHAKVEDKPEVKKAGGVYYTPTYIVDYIVKNTVGKLLEQNTPTKVSGLRILDPACGSGSFLLGAYQTLLDWHQEWYTKHEPEKHAKGRSPKVYLGPGGEWRLTTPEKKRILLNNIYGVDIDTQAVEVTKLSLLLKVLEGENAETLGKNLRLFHERALPDLGDNIKCGNSLIGPDFYEGKQLHLLDEEERYRINAFDWPAEFPHIFSSPSGKPHLSPSPSGRGQGEGSGFDAVIGNPPYLNIDDTWGRGDPRQRYIKRHYGHIYNDKTDILFYFLAQAVELSQAHVGFIVSRAFLEAYKADKLRAWLSNQCSIRKIIDFQNNYVFRGVGITTAVVLLDTSNTPKDATIHRLIETQLPERALENLKSDSGGFQTITVEQEAFTADPWLFAGSDIDAFLKKIDNQGEPIGNMLIVGQGMQTGRNNVFGKLTKTQLDKWEVGPQLGFIRARNSDIRRYYLHDSQEWLLYLEDVAQFEDLPTEVQNHLRAHESELKARAAYKRGDCRWWRYTWPLHREHLLRRKLYCPYLASYNRFVIDQDQRFLGLTDTTVLFENDQPEDLLYLLGLLNSQVLTFRFRYIGKLKSGGIIEYFWNSVSKMPIRRIDFSDSVDKARHNRMVKLVEGMLNLHKDLQAAKTSHEKSFIQRQIKETDKQIDQLVYELYGLTDEEIRIVEEVTK